VTPARLGGVTVSRRGGFSWWGIRAWAPEPVKRKNRERGRGRDQSKVHGEARQEGR